VVREPAPAAARRTVELVPATCWYSNARSDLDPADWDRVRRAVYRAAGYRCEICGGRGEQHPVECHELWLFDERRLVQRLVRMMALCPACHHVKHLGAASAAGHGTAARAHLAAVNGWTTERAERHIADAFATWQRRSRQEWQLDITHLAAYGVTPRRHAPERVEVRREQR
jgi:hypothetical protein